MLNFIVDSSNNGVRLDKYLSIVIPDCSRSFLQKLIVNGSVTSSDNLVLNTPRASVKTGMTINVLLPTFEKVEPIEAEDFNFEILYEDEFLLVINKNAGVVVHPAVGNMQNTVLNALLSRYPQLASRATEGDMRPGIVHRLDKDTSGCLIIAKQPEAQFKLGEIFSNRQVRKKYLAIVRGELKHTQGEISNLIGRHPVNRQKMAVVSRNGKQAISRYKVKDVFEVNGLKLSLLEVEILTGRTHQIRVHCSSIGHPVLGDKVYGGTISKLEVPRQLLHAWKLEIPHPITGALLKIEAPIPDDFQNILLNTKKII